MGAESIIYGGNLKNILEQIFVGPNFGHLKKFRHFCPTKFSPIRYLWRNVLPFSTC